MSKNQKCYSDDTVVVAVVVKVIYLSTYLFILVLALVSSITRQYVFLKNPDYCRFRRKTVSLKVHVIKMKHISIKKKQEVHRVFLKINQLKSVFHTSVLLLITNFAITLLK